MSRPNIPYLPQILLALACLAFMVAKWSDLSLPFYWDELGVYGPGVLYMVDNGPGLLPSALEPELSRGHPLLFYFLFSAFSKTFGFSLFKIHLLALLLFLALVISTFELARMVLNDWWGLAAASLLLVMPNLFATANMVLPEVLVALLILRGVIAVLKEKWWRYLLWASLLMLTKESGIVLPCAVLGYAILEKKARSWQNGAIALGPLLSFGIFLLIQKMQNGWFFFPYHTSLISFEKPVMLYKLKLWYELMFVKQGRFLWGFLLVMGGIIGMGKMLKQKSQLLTPWMKLSLIFGIGYFLFSIINFYMDRYQTTMFPFYAVWLCLAIAQLPPLLPHKVFSAPHHILLFGILIVLPLLNFTKDRFWFDQDINYRKVVRIQQEVSRYLEETVAAEEPFFANFPLYNGLLDKRFGFRSNDKELAPTVRLNDSLRYTVIFRPGTDLKFSRWDSLSVPFEREDGFVRLKVFERKP
ncbi:MAG: glycosyltransferase family 39 protein [Bacteroidota bacterium]